MSEVADADSLWVNRRIVRNTVAVNYLGLCAITMPVGCDRAGMPVGLELTASAEGRCAMILPLRALFLRRGRGNSLAAGLPGETIAVSACSRHEERHRQACCFHRR